MKTLTTVAMKTLALDGTLNTVRLTLDDVPLGQYQAVSPDQFQTPFTPIAQEVYVDVRPSSETGVKLSIPFVKMVVPLGAQPRQLDVGLLLSLHLRLQAMDGISHHPVMQDPFMEVKQYKFSDAVWESILRSIVQE